MTKQGRKWRLSYDSSPTTRISLEDAGDFDEFVLEDWLHIEKMDKRDWWMRVGDAYVNAHVHLDGRVSVYIRRGEYGDIVGRTEVPE